MNGVRKKMHFYNRRALQQKSLGAKTPSTHCEMKPKANETLNIRTAHILYPESFKTAKTVISVSILEYFYFVRSCDTTKYTTHIIQMWVVYETQFHNAMVQPHKWSLNTKSKPCCIYNRKGHVVIVIKHILLAIYLLS